MNKPSLNKTLLINIILIIFLYGFVVGIVLVLQHYYDFKTDTDNLKIEYTKEKRELLKTEVNKIIDFVKYKKSHTEERLKDIIKTKVEEVHNIAENIYNENITIYSEKDVQKLIKDALRPIRYNDGRGYIFITSMQGVEILYPTNPEYEDQNIINLQDDKGNYVIRDEIEIVKKHGAGFVIDYWMKPDKKEGMVYPKISYVKYFEPFDWYIGTGEYLDDYQEVVKKEVLQWIANISYGKDGDIFVINNNGNIIMNNPDNTDIGKNITEKKDIEGKEYVKEYLEIAKNNDSGGFVEYLSENEDSEIYSCISFVKSYNDWNWIIGSDIDMLNLEETISEREQNLFENFMGYIIIIFVALFVFIISAVLLAGLFTKKTKDNFETLITFFDKAGKNFKKIKTKFLNYIEFERLADSANRMIDARVKAEAKVKDSLKEKETLLKEIHHRVKNNLQVIISLLNLQSRTIKDKETLKVFRDSQDRIRSMAMIHEKLYKSKNLSKVNFSEYIRELTFYLFKTYEVSIEKVKLRIDVGVNNMLLIDKAIPCGLIINEIVTNSIKYAFPNNKEGEIHITMRIIDKLVELIIWDNGVGIPDNISVEEPETLGLELVNMLVKQIDADMEYNLNQGVYFKIEFDE